MVFYGRDYPSPSLSWAAAVRLSLLLFLATSHALPTSNFRWPNRKQGPFARAFGIGGNNENNNVAHLDSVRGGSTQLPLAGVTNTSIASEELADSALKDLQSAL